MAFLVELTSAASIRSFENPNAPLWAELLLVWWLLSFIAPGIFVGLVADRRHALCGIGAGVVGCVLLSIYIWSDWARCCTDPQFPPPYTQWLWRAAVYTAWAAGFGWLTSLVARHWSSNHRIERAHEG